MLEETLLLDHVSARELVHKLARKTRQISSNWLRTYLLECTDQSTRGASVRIFSAAAKSCVSSKVELQALNEWSKAWKDYFSEVLKKDVLANAPTAVPCSLGGSWSAHEDVEKLDGGGASSLGVIISYINVLLEALPRSWRYSSEVCLFIRFLASMPYENHESVFREPMIAAMIPPRLIALATRERAPSILRSSFPGVSLASEVANSQMRGESNATAHVMPMSGSQVLNASELNNARGPVAADYLILLEALGCLAGLPGANYVPLVRDDEHARGRQRFVLSEPAVKALSIVFQESCAPGAPGMGQREIEAYLHRRGVDTGSVSTQKIADMLSKYPTTTGGNGSTAGTYLSLEGFLAYYRDTAQTNDMRVRHDLHSFGFRPDLTRRSRSSRVVFIGERESQRLPAESVAVDVAEHFKERSADLGILGNMGLGYGFHIFSLAHNVCEPLAEYLVAAATYRKTTANIITRTLQMIFSTPNDWGGNETVSAATMILDVIASIPDPDQNNRIATIMQCTEKASRNVAYGAGLLQVARSFHRARQTQHYNNDFHWCFERYIGVLKELRHIYPIFKWMQDNQAEWSFMERELLDAHSVATQENQARGDYAPRDTGNAIPLDQHTHSDSDMAGMNDSEDDDEDSQFDAVNTFGNNTENDGPYQIIVEGAGNPAVNGVYVQDGYFEQACRFVKDGLWNKKQRKFYILQCHVSNNTKHWYISIVPSGASAGTSSDIDFYTAPLSDEDRHIPPAKEWTISTEGRSPPPELVFRTKHVGVSDSPERPFTGGFVQEDENQEDPSQYI
jgi:ubiquitin carboxyl-terminal hydrolase 9/24